MRVILGREEFLTLVSGGEFVRPAKLASPAIEIALADIGFAQMRDCIEEAEAKAEVCEHGVWIGDYCGLCNAEYKRAANDPSNQ